MKKIKDRKKAEFVFLRLTVSFPVSGEKHPVAENAAGLFKLIFKIFQYVASVMQKTEFPGKAHIPEVAAYIFRNMMSCLDQYQFSAFGYFLYFGNVPDIAGIDDFSFSTFYFKRKRLPFPLRLWQMIIVMCCNFETVFVKNKTVLNAVLPDFKIYGKAAFGAGQHFPYCRHEAFSGDEYVKSFSSETRSRCGKPVYFSDIPEQIWQSADVVHVCVRNENRP